MANVTKIYELRTLGYNQLITELKNVEAQFTAIKKVKQELNQSKFSEEDADRLRKVNAELKQAKINYAELRLEKQRLKNEAIAENNIRQQQITQQKVVNEGIKAEAGSLKDLINQRKQLNAIVQNTRPGSGTTLPFGTQNLTNEQAAARLAQVNQQIAAMTGNMRNMGNVGSNVTSALSAGFERMRGSLGAMILTYAGWFTAFREAGQLIAENIKLSDSFADLQIRIHGTKEDVEDLVNELKKIDTRTSLIGLVDIANIIAKKGVPREDIAALTAEFDKLNVVLGKEIGEPATAAANIIKLITIFNDDKQVTAERVNEIATSLFKLTTTGVATGEFLVNFAERVGAVRGITGLTLPAILGMGAALQQLGQRTEVAGTAAVQLTTRIFSDVPKFAAAAGKSIQDFRKLLDESPFEALIQVSEGLKGLSESELAAEFEEVVSAFQEVGIVGVRVKAVLGDIATNANFVRDRMNTAAVTTKDYANQTAALELKQNTFAATLQRIRKELELLATNKGVQVTLAAVGTVILAIISSLNIIIPILGVYAALWAVANARMIAAWISSRALSIALAVQHTVLAAGQVVIRAYVALLTLMRNALNSVTSASTMTGAYLRALGASAVIAALALVVIYLDNKAKKAREAAEQLRRLSEAQRLNTEITKRATQATAEQISRLDILSRVITSNITSIDTKKKALEQLIGISSLFSEVIKGNTVDVNALTTALNNVRGQILLTAKVQAAADLSTDKYKQFLSVVTARQIVETRSAEGNTDLFAGKRVNSVNTRDLPQEDRDLIYGMLPSPDPKGDMLIDGVLYNSEKVFSNINEKEKSFLKSYELYTNTSSKLQAELDRQKAANQPLVDAQARVTLENRIDLARTTPQSIPELGALIAEIDNAREKLKEGNPKLDALLKDKEEFEARLKKLRGDKDSGGRESRLGLENFEKDALSLIEADRRLSLAQRELAFAELQKDHRATYQEEEKYINDIRDIQQLYLGYKIAYLERQKTLNAREKETLAGFKKELIDIELKAVQDVQKIKDQEFNERSRELRRQLENQINEINDRTAVIEGDVSISATDRAQARLNADREILALQEKFNVNIDALEKELNQKSEENLRQGSKTRQDIVKDIAQVLEAEFQDARDAAGKIQDEFKERAANQTIDLLNSNKNASQIAKEILQIRNRLARELLAAEVAALKIELDLYEKGLKSKLKTEAEYQKAKTEYKEKEAQLVEDTVNRELNAYERLMKGLKDFGNVLKEQTFNIKSYTDDSEGEAEKQRDAFVEAAQIIGQAQDEAIRGFFEGQRQQVDARRDAHLERLDLEEEQLKARAQSEAEIESIEKQFDAKRKLLEKQAAEEKKKIALKEITIDFARFVAKSLAQYGLPLALIPIAAGTALYFVQRANINKQTFEEGGIIDTKKGGPIRGNSHKHGGVKFNYEAEGDELAIVNKKSARDTRIRTITGTNMQIASAINRLGGGIEFKSGASIRHFDTGGILGSNFTAPLYSPSSNGQDVVEYIAEIRNLAIEQSRRIDRIEVVQVTETVTNAQKKQVKQNLIGVLP